MDPIYQKPNIKVTSGSELKAPPISREFQSTIERFATPSHVPRDFNAESEYLGDLFKNTLYATLNRNITGALSVPKMVESDEYNWREAANQSTQTVTCAPSTPKNLSRSSENEVGVPSGWQVRSA